MDIELPNGQIAEFPDDMPHDQIESVLQKQFPSLKASSSDKDAAFQEISNKYPGMPKFLINALLPIATKMAETPQDNERGTTAGAFLRSAARAPLESSENLASLIGLPVNRNAKWPGLISESESDLSHPFAELGGSLAGFIAPGGAVVKALRSIPAWGEIAAKAAPSLLRRLPVYSAEGAVINAGLSPPGHRGEGALTGATLGAAGATIPSITRGFMGLKERISSLRNLDRLRDEGKITQEQYKTAVNDEEALKELSKNQGIGSDFNKMEAEVPNLEQQANQLSSEIQATPKVNTENMLGAPTGEDLVPEAESLLKSTEKNIAEHEQDISSSLGEGNAHRKQFAQKINPILEERQAEVGKGFNKYVADLKGKNITLSNPRDAREVAQDLRKAITENGYSSPEVKKLATELDNIGNSKEETIPADKFVASYRTLQSLANKTRSSAYGKSPQEFNQLIERADAMDADVARMEEVIDNGLGKDSLEKLNKLKHRYATEIAPLFRNKFYQHLQANNKAPANMMEQLTNEPYIRSANPNKITGTQILNEIIRNDPELLKNVVGEKFANNPKQIHEWDETANEFIQHMPELQNKIGQYKNLLETRQGHIENVSRSKQKASEMKSEAERINRVFEEEKKTQGTRSKKEIELKELQDKIADYKRNIPELKKKASATNISLQKKMELEAKVAKAEKDRDQLIKKSIWIGLGIGGEELWRSYSNRRVNSNY